MEILYSLYTGIGFSNMMINPETYTCIYTYVC